MIMSRIKIEVCVDSLESAKAAIEAGANRLEICANLGVGGGTTPSAGLVHAIKIFIDVEFLDEEKIELMAMIRPRIGDFVYTQEEIAVMRMDLEGFARIGVTGVVFGCLLPDGTIDKDATDILIERAAYHGIKCCFHRAFDMVKDQQQALQLFSEDPLSYISRILTSGGGPSAPSSIESLKEIFSAVENINETRKSSDPDAETLTIMPGSGINAETVETILKELLPLGLTYIHLSGGVWMRSKMKHRVEDMGMGLKELDWKVWKTDGEKIRAVRRIADRVWNNYTAIDVISDKKMDTS